MVDHAPLDLDGDLIEQFVDEDEVWFTAEALAAASNVEIAADGPEDPLLRPSRGLGDLERWAIEPGLSLESLPGWEGDEAGGAGWGAELQAMVGPLRPGFIGVLTGSRASGKTAWLTQLADGLAGRESTPLTPVAWCSQRGRADALGRTLARHLGVDRRRFRDRGAREGDVEALWQRARAAMHGPLATTTSRQRFVPWSDSPRGVELALALASGVPRWARQVGPSTWPVVIVDDLAGWSGDDGVAATLEMLAVVARRVRLIVFVTVERDELELLRRYADVVLDVLAGEVAVSHNRRGPRGALPFALDASTGRVAVGSSPVDSRR
jgi:hypothetical protein